LKSIGSADLQIIFEEMYILLGAGISLSV